MILHGKGTLKVGLRDLLNPRQVWCYPKNPHKKQTGALEARKSETERERHRDIK